MKLSIKKGTTSKRLAIFVLDSSQTDGRGLAGLVFNSAGLAWYYWREDAGAVGGTAVTLATATRGTFASGGFIEKDATNMPGFYEIGIPDAALATGAGWVVMVLRGATNMAPVTLEIQLVDNTTLDVYDRLGAPTGASVSADIAAVQADTDNVQTRIPAALVSGRMDSSVGAMAADVVTAAAIATDAIGSAELAQAAADKVWSSATRSLTDKVGFALSAAGIQAIWDALTSALTFAGSIGKLIVDNLNATVGSRSTQASVDAVDDLLDTEVAAILADTTQIKADLPTRITKNVALPAFPFFVVDSADHVTGKTGLTVTAQRSIDGAAFANCANAVGEIGLGWYRIDLAAADLNGNTIALKFTAAGADARMVTIVTQPT